MKDEKAKLEITDKIQSGEEHVNLSGQGLTSDDVRWLGAALLNPNARNIKSLDFSNNEFTTVPPSFFNDLIEHPALTTVNFKDCGLLGQMLNQAEIIPLTNTLKIKAALLESTAILDRLSQEPTVTQRDIEPLLQQHKTCFATPQLFTFGFKELLKTLQQDYLSKLHQLAHLLCAKAVADPKNGTLRGVATAIANLSVSDEKNKTNITDEMREVLLQDQLNQINRAIDAKPTYKDYYSDLLKPLIPLLPKKYNKQVYDTVINLFKKWVTAAVNTGIYTMKEESLFFQDRRGEKLFQLQQKVLAQKTLQEISRILHEFIQANQPKTSPNYGVNFVANTSQTMKNNITQFQQQWYGDMPEHAFMAAAQPKLAKPRKVHTPEEVARYRQQQARQKKRAASPVQDKVEETGTGQHKNAMAYIMSQLERIPGAANDETTGDAPPTFAESQHDPLIETAPKEQPPMSDPKKNIEGATAPEMPMKSGPTENIEDATAPTEKEVLQMELEKQQRALEKSGFRPSKSKSQPTSSTRMSFEAHLRKQQELLEEASKHKPGMKK